MLDPKTRLLPCVLTGTVNSTHNHTKRVEMRGNLHANTVAEPTPALVVLRAWYG